MLARLRRETQRTLLDLGPEVIFEAGHTILRQGDDSSHVVLLLSGSAKVQALSESGGPTLLGIRFGGDLVGEMAALERRARSATVIAGAHTRARLIKSTDFRRFLSEHADAAVAMILMVNARLRWANRRRIDNANLSATKRVPRVLLEVVDTYGEQDSDGNWRIGPPLNHEELATLAGVRLRTVEKALRDLHEQDVLQRGYRSIVVTDLPRLREISDYSG
ncbi:Crp/Fnr family transcriptional regulator [Saccharopolyspora sp. NFXS83]|uniref:Crp/Fnr family transcriptional regulator n=1 Tax=Saccharopolyspora sp. NFXS83 TaxID=2993560 RepID=UPI00224ADC17|nr:Crp/Fnr family transcriptional regulator [Saccharopolyspora sp. NFXS83]MCX2728777.1 Crp/Fnr family transcriptional regulator [Saccharopolyspora sp. NFXS83]